MNRIKKFPKTRRRYDSNWRAYQRRLKLVSKRERRIQKMKQIAFYSLVSVVFLLAAFHADSMVSSVLSVMSPFSMEKPEIQIQENQKKQTVQKLTKTDARNMLSRGSYLQNPKKSFPVTYKNQNYRVVTTLDPSLQQFVINSMDTKYAMYLGIVVMDPNTGRILAMAGHNRENSLSDPCTKDNFPAASIFKIITAAAAIEKCGFNENTTISYCGANHTLYKSQIRKNTKRKTRSITLKDSFAKSINPVFGKIGVHNVGRQSLESFARAFGFNRRIGSELPVARSSLLLTEEPYQWAEIASGFNRTTRITPLHGALIASSILNNGIFLDPIFIEHIEDENGRQVYANYVKAANRSISPKTAEVLENLMKATVQKGTARKNFRKYRNDPVLSRIEIGGKTGSINSRETDYLRFDWFVGFAREKEGDEQIVVSIMVGHHKFLGTSSRDYARMIFQTHFERYFSKKDNAVQKDTQAGISRKKQLITN